MAKQETLRRVEEDIAAGNLGTEAMRQAQADCALFVLAAVGLVTVLDGLISLFRQMIHR